MEDDGEASDAEDSVPPPNTSKAKAEAKARTVPPGRVHIIPLSPWLVELAVRLVKRYHMAKPCLLCAYRTLYYLFEVGKDSIRILEGKAICMYVEQRCKEGDPLLQLLEYPMSVFAVIRLGSGGHMWNGQGSKFIMDQSVMM